MSNTPASDQIREVRCGLRSIMVFMVRRTPRRAGGLLWLEGYVHPAGSTGLPAAAARCWPGDCPGVWSGWRFRRPERADEGCIYVLIERRPAAALCTRRPIAHRPVPWRD